MQRWKKIKHVFSPAEEHPWMLTHAANPFAEQISEHIFRIYFTSRNAASQSHITWADFDASQDFKLIKIAAEPVVAPGAPGLFDDSGAAMGWLLNKDGKRLLYYLGWNLKVTVPWLNTIGLAVSNAETGVFEKYSRVPLLDRSEEDPFSISYPAVLFDQGIYRMWYGSNLAWGKEQHEMEHVFKYAESPDGLHWKRSGRIAVGLEHAGEYALSKPMVLKDGDTYRMWYSYRASAKGDTYRIGYAESADGFTWKRMDEKVDLDVSAEGWDSEMICYPFVFDYKGKRLMLYNGNGYGRTGFGLAELA